MSRLRVYLRLGRVSNLPTVWTNVAAGCWLSGAAPGAGRYAVLAAALSLFYVGGMFLNDAFDREIDARERPERPIPAGLVAAAEVFAIGYGLLATGFAVVLIAGSWRALPAALALGAAIVLYDAWHKKNPLSPVLMGACRVLVYLTASLAVSGALPRPVLLGAAALFCHLVGLTYAAKQEHLARPGSAWPLVFLAAPLVYALSLPALFLFAVDVLAVRLFLRRRVPPAIMLLIAGISLLDALLLWPVSREVALITALGFPATLFFQRFIRGT